MIERSPAEIPAAGLVYVAPDAAGLSRRRAGRGFVYTDAAGRRVTDPEVLARIRALAIPPAWRRVWICPDPQGHLQAIGYDERGRRQYRYHPRFRAHQDQVKFEHLLAFAEALPALRRAVSQDLAQPGLGRRKVLAAVVRLLETTLIRVGNAEYARQNRSYGLTTLRNRHVRVERAELKFQFKGKAGKIWSLSLHDRRIARVVRSCQELPGQHLFEYRDEHGRVQPVNSAAINAYLKEITGVDITAKDFRTWHGTVLAALALGALKVQGEPPTQRNLRRAIDQVAARLGNTPAICRRCYVHPEILSAYLENGLDISVAASAEPEGWLGLRPEEEAVLAFLKARLQPAAAAV